MTITVSQEELKIVLERLDEVKIEISRLRAALLPEEEPTEEEKKAIEAGKKEIAQGKKTKLDDLAKELC
jgi:hypothetical protein